jgi:hypothetical protein
MNTTVKIYLIGADSRFLGDAEHDPYKPLPRCTLTPPPATTDEEVALWMGDKWAVTPKESASQHQNKELLAAAIRTERKRLLAECDWTQLPDAPVDQTRWATYRQALRDVTAQAGFPENVLWPEMPA